MSRTDRLVIMVLGAAIWSAVVNVTSGPTLFGLFVLLVLLIGGLVVIWIK